MRRRIPLAAALVSTSLSCAPRREAAVPSPVIPAVARPAAAPATQPARGLALRPTQYWSFILRLQQAYVTHEGSEHRGDAFERLAGALSQLNRGSSNESPQPVSELEVLTLLGPPDFADSDARGAELVYLYQRSAPKDWALYIDIDSHGFLTRIGWNATAVNGVADLHPYRLAPLPWEQPPATQPARPQSGSGYLGVAYDAVSWEDGGYLYTGLHGVQVTGVAADSPASRAGLRPGDVIERIDKDRTDADTFLEQTSHLRPGQSVVLTVMRPTASQPHKRVEIPATIGPRPAATQAAKP